MKTAQEADKQLLGAAYQDYNEDRRRLAQKMEQNFFQGNRQTAPDQKTPQAETAQALRLLQENPDMAKLIIAALGRTSNG